MKRRFVFILLLLLLILPTACGTNEPRGGSGTEPMVDRGSSLVVKDEGEDIMAKYDFSVFTNVEIIGADLSSMSEEQLEVLYQQARYCQAMTDADTDTLREMVPKDAVFTHMSGRQQTREEYFADIEDGSLRYFSIGIDTPVVEVEKNSASITYTSVLDANAYGAKGVYRMSGTHWFEKQDGKWYSVNSPNR